VAHEVRIQRVYEGVPAKGSAVLVDRVWPRGIKKEKLGRTLWLRELGPSNELRGWFGHKAERWEEFRRRYSGELDRPEQRELLEQLVELARKGSLTLLYSARDTEHNQAAVIREVVEERLRS
jgi:uncharacterized protein YeaO (DUF488 family)